MGEIEFPELKTFKEEVLDIAKSWARQHKCTLAEATEIIARFARDNYLEVLNAKVEKDQRQKNG